MRRVRRLLVAVSSGTALAVLAGAASAQQSNAAVAEALFRDAQRLFAEGHIHDACDKFAASQKTDPALGTLLNLAVCHERDGRSATAWLEFSEAASDAQQAGDAPRQKYAESRLQKIEPTLHKVALDAEAPADGIVLVLDTTSVPASAFGVGIPVDPGEHDLRASAPGRAPWSWHFTTNSEPGTERISVPALKIAETLPPAPVTPASPPRTLTPQPLTEPPHSGESGLDLRHELAYGGLALAAVGIGAGIYFGVSTANHTSKRDSLCPPNLACYDQHAFDEYHAAQVSQRWMLVTGGVGLVAAGAAAALLIVPLTSENKRASLSVHASPWLAPGALGASAAGTF